MENQLSIIVKESGLEQSKAQIILEKFTNYFEIAAEWEKKINTLVVTDVSQVAEMKMAREARLFLKGKRLDVENVRKEMKEQSLREGQTIDSIAKILKNLIIPLEDKAEEIEKFAEIQHEKMLSSRLDERQKKLAEFELDLTFVDLKNMPEEVFQRYYDDQKAAKEKREQEEKRIEAERLAKEKAEKEEQERIRLENEKLKKEQERIEKEREEERKKQAAELEKQRKESERREAELKAKAEAERKETERIQKEKDEKGRIEREKIEAENRRIQAELTAKIEAELKEEKEKERIEQERITAANKAAKSPDKEKLVAMIKSIKMTIPEMKTKEGEAVKGLIIEKMESFKIWAKNQINNFSI